jgi:hypothetical protein
MEAVLTEDFETGFVGGMVWKGPRLPVPAAV